MIIAVAPQINTGSIKKPGTFNVPRGVTTFLNSLVVWESKFSTGTINNLIGVDIDDKNEFQKYIKEYGEPQTVKQITPSGGEHYIFLLNQQILMMTSITIIPGLLKHSCFTELIQTQQ